MNNLIVMATYWNEKDWVRASLAQIDKLDPLEVVICDGCFEPGVPNYSTDGTREVLEAYVRERPNATLISARRERRLEGLFAVLRGHGRSPKRCLLTPARAKGLAWSACNVAYRLNQALTFQRMIEVSRYWAPGRWFMTYDSDQFCSDEMLEAFDIVNRESHVGILLGTELTFFNGFHHYTDEHEHRQYSNMPHKILPETTFIPTRGILVETWSRRSFAWKDKLLNESYLRKTRSLHVGHYFHYKFKFDPRRYEAGYQLGDRVAPDVRRYRMKEFLGRHPKVVERFFGDRIAQERSDEEGPNGE